MEECNAAFPANCALDHSEPSGAQQQYVVVFRSTANKSSAPRSYGKGELSQSFFLLIEQVWTRT